MPNGIMNIINKIFIFFALPFSINAQSSGISPYSMFGLGQTQISSFIYGEILGGTQIGNNSTFYVNNGQPASYSQLKYTTLDIGGSYKAIHQTSPNGDLWNTTGGFRSMGMALPLSKSLGASMGVTPFTQVGYDMRTEGIDDNFGNFVQLFNGKGGINKAHVGFGYMPFSIMSFGVNFNYLFGSSDRSAKILFEDNQLNSIMNNERLLVNDWSVDFGSMVHIPVKGNRLNIGLTYSPEQDIAAIHDNSSFTYIPNSSGTEIPLDTVFSAYRPDGFITLPNSLGIGFQYEKLIKGLNLPAWSASFQYKFVGQQELRDFWHLNKPSLGPFAKNSQVISFSGSIIPVLAFPQLRYKSALSNLAYRASFRRGNTGLVINDKSINSWQAGLGLGIPLGGRTVLPGDIKFATLHFGLQMGNLGTNSIETVNEFSLLALVGVTLNDQWFLKFKYR